MTRTMTELRARFIESAEVLATHRDLLDERPAHALAGPRDGEGAALDARGWRDFLLALDDTSLDALEAAGLDAAWPTDAPASLLALRARARKSCALPGLVADDARPDEAARRHETPRKQAQVDALAHLLAPLLPRAQRVIDVGSGHGHLTRAIAARLAREGGVRVVGLERDAALAARARVLAAEHGVAHAIMFARTDVVQDGLSLTASDCVIGLHACGELGDALVQEGARADASVVLVGCCLQKRRASERAPLVEGALAWPRALLGLSNLTLREEGVEASRAENLAARARRLALMRLLAQAGAPVAFGAEMTGLNRRAAHQPLEQLVTRAFALRGLALPSARVIDEAASWAQTQHARVRRLQLPRTLLGRVLEVHIALERALHLEERGHQVTVGLAFPAQVSARNVVIVAHAR